MSYHVEEQPNKKFCVVDEHKRPICDTTRNGSGLPIEFHSKVMAESVVIELNRSPEED